MKYLFLLVLCSFFVVAFPASDVIDVSPSVPCLSVFVVVNGSLPISNGEYFLSDCVFLDNNSWSCGCDIYLHTLESTVNNYSLTMVVTYEDEVVVPSSSGGGGSKRKRVVKNFSVKNVVPDIPRLLEMSLEEDGEEDKEEVEGSEVKGEVTAPFVGSESQFVWSDGAKIAIIVLVVAIISLLTILFYQKKDDVS